MHTIVVKGTVGFPPVWVSKIGSTSRDLEVGLIRDGVLVPWGTLSGPGGSGAPQLRLRPKGGLPASTLSFDLVENEIGEFADDVHFVSTFSIDGDPTADFSIDDPTGILFGGATIAGGVLDVTGVNSDDYLDYASIGLPYTANPQRGTIRVTYIPDFSGTNHPSNRDGQVLFLGDSAATDNNAIELVHDSSGAGGKLRAKMHDQAGLVLFDDGPVLSVTAGTPIELEINYDLTLGQAWYFTDGTLFNGSPFSFTPATRTPSGGGMRLGQSRILSAFDRLDGSIDDAAVFSAVQHSTDYAPSGPPVPVLVGLDTFQAKRVWETADFASLAPGFYLAEVDASVSGSDISFPGGGYFEVQWVGHLE